MPYSELCLLKEWDNELVFKCCLLQAPYNSFPGFLSKYVSSVASLQEVMMRHGLIQLANSNRIAMKITKAFLMVGFL